MLALFVRKPERTTEKEEEPDMPFSGIYLFGPQHVVTGIQELSREPRKGAPPQSFQPGIREATTQSGS